MHLFRERFPEKCSTFHSNARHYKEEFECSFHPGKYRSHMTWIDCKVGGCTSVISFVVNVSGQKHHLSCGRMFKNCKGRITVFRFEQNDTIRPLKILHKKRFKKFKVNII